MSGLRHTESTVQLKERNIPLYVQAIMVAVVTVANLQLGFIRSHSKPSSNAYAAQLANSPFHQSIQTVQSNSSAFWIASVDSSQR
jgi:hypothetical protein